MAKILQVKLERKIEGKGNSINLPALIHHLVAMENMQLSEKCGRKEWRAIVVYFEGKDMARKDGLLEM